MAKLQRSVCWRRKKVILRICSPFLILAVGFWIFKWSIPTYNHSESSNQLNVHLLIINNSFSRNTKIPVAYPSANVSIIALNSRGVRTYSFVCIEKRDPPITSRNHHILDWLSKKNRKIVLYRQKESGIKQIRTSGAPHTSLNYWDLTFKTGFPVGNYTIKMYRPSSSHSVIQLIYVIFGTTNLSDCIAQ